MAKKKNPPAEQAAAEAAITGPEVIQTTIAPSIPLPTESSAIQVDASSFDPMVPLLDRRLTSAEVEILDLRAELAVIKANMEQMAKDLAGVLDREPLGTGFPAFEGLREVVDHRAADILGEYEDNSP